MKLELLWLQDWEDMAEIEAACSTWRMFYNTERPHEALKWLTPAEYRALLLGERPALGMVA